jgi:RNA polymerase sigma-70 factor (ECF subfamily)
MDSGDENRVNDLKAFLTKSDLPVESASLVAQFYAGLRRCAAAIMRNERSDHTLQPTALVNEAFPRLSAIDIKFRDKQHFLAVAIRTMRQVLCDYARAHKAAKRGAGERKVSAEDLNLGYHDRFAEDVLAYDDALNRVGPGFEKANLKKTDRRQHGEH